MNNESQRQTLTENLEKVRVDPGLTTFLLRGESLSDCTVSRIVFEKDLTEVVITDVLAYADRLTDREFIAYDPSYQLASNQVIADDISSLDALKRVHDVVERNDVDVDVDDGTAVLAMVHRVVSPGADAITVYRLKGAGIATRRAKGVFTLLFNQGVFEKAEREILFYEPSFDVLVTGNDVIVATITLLARKLESPERAQAKARAVFDDATAEISIAGADELREAVASDPAMIAKMMAVSRLLELDPGYRELLTTDKIVKFLAKNPHIHIDVVGSGPKAQLVFDPSPQKRYRILKTLADDYLTSQLSGRDYEAGSKLRL